MARSRNIKPGFFKNELLVQLPFETRLLFIGLWTLADREGRLEDRSIRIRMEIFPADSVDVEAGLQSLHDRGFILRYQIGGDHYIQIIAFHKHQNPHHKEVQSVIPSPQNPEALGSCMETKPEAAPAMHADETRGKPEVSLGLEPRTRASNRADSLIPDSRTLEQQAARSTAKRSDRFEEFWATYPVKKGRADALKTWTTRRLDAIADTIIADVKRRIAEDRQWIDGYIPHGSTYVNGKGWEDAIEQRSTGRGERSETPEYLRGAI